MAKRGGHKPRKMFIHLREDTPSFNQVKPSSDFAPLFYERGFFGLVWMESGVRKTRDLKNW